MSVLASPNRLPYLEALMEGGILCSLENWWLHLHELDKLDLNSGESEAVGKADSVL